MASRVEMIGCLIFVATLLTGGATAATYNVGDVLGWNIPPGGASAYATWARTKDFDLGDIISFGWSSGTQNVAEVSKGEYDNCTANNPIGTIRTANPTTFTLDSNSTRYFICTVERHCDAGQKVTIALDSSSAASSLSTSAFSALLLAVAISFLSHM